MAFPSSSSYFFFKLKTARWLIDWFLLHAKRVFFCHRRKQHHRVLWNLFFLLKAFPLNIPDIVVVDPANHSEAKPRSWNNVMSGLLKAVQRLKQPSPTLLNLQRLANSFFKARVVGHCMGPMWIPGKGQRHWYPVEQHFLWLRQM